VNRQGNSSCNPALAEGILIHRARTVKVIVRSIEYFICPIYEKMAHPTNPVE
jgi:hypothetical protein